MLTILKSLLSQRFVPSIADQERDYLNGSVSRYDLECREREIDRGRFRSLYPNH